MTASYRRHSSTTSSSGRSSGESSDSYDLDSNASNAPPSRCATKPTGGNYRPASYDEDISPSTSCYPRSSVDTYSSDTSDDEMDLDLTREDELDFQEIPALPIYRREIAEANVRPSSPQDFAKLFPSMNRLSIRHDDFTSDGNMNLRIETVVPGRRRTAIQLFHLRMYDLAKREFSLRRYCRDSGREVCNAKRKYVEPAADGRPNLQRSVTSAFKNIGNNPAFRRTGSFSSSKRPGSSYSSHDGDNDGNGLARTSSSDSRLSQKERKVPTDAIKLEFSNYARVDVERRGSRTAKRYDFDWWGHKYSWKRIFEKHLNVVSFHLVRDGNATPVAHIVPETRSPNQIAADEDAGGWIPPCYMWISDKSVIDCMTDVADVIMATGLMALVDDCITERWQPKKVHRIPVPLTSKSVPFEVGSPKSLVQQIFNRRASQERPYPSYRHATPISAY